jgi:hypothetical protein
VSIAINFAIASSSPEFDFVFNRSYAFSGEIEVILDDDLMCVCVCVNVQVIM